MTAPTFKSLLRDTSRSFYLTLQILPAPVRQQIGLAYLLARTSDTVADCNLVPFEMRLSCLAALRDRIDGTWRGPIDFNKILPAFESQKENAERTLLQRCEEAVQLLAGLDEADVRRIRDVLSIIISGQAMDLKRFGTARFPALEALKTDDELDDYTYRVAGCVGEFWTRMCVAHLFSKETVDEPMLLRDGVLFGKGLQLVNVLRDIPADLQNGRCYMPRQSLGAIGMKPEDLCVAANEPRFRPYYNTLLDRAQSYLEAGWNYTNRIPISQKRLRLALAWPVLFGAGTLRLLRRENVLDSTRRIKVPRSEINAIMLRSIFYFPFQRLWKSQFTRALGT